MQKKILFLAMVAMAPSIVPAADLSLNFSGNILNQTCTINSGASLSVPLGTVSAVQFRSVGDIAATTSFTVRLSSCPAGITRVTGVFEAGNNVDPATGYLNIIGAGSGGKANGVKIRLLNNALAVVRADGGKTPPATIVGNNAEIPLFAQYISTNNPVTAGAVETSVSFSILYN